MYCIDKSTNFRLKRTWAVNNKKTTLGFQVYIGRKPTKKATQVQTWTIFYVNERTSQGTDAESRANICKSQRIRKPVAQSIIKEHPWLPVEDLGAVPNWIRIITDL